MKRFLRSRLVLTLAAFIVIAAAIAIPLSGNVRRAHAQGTVTFTEFPLPTGNGDPVGITAGPDGNLWFTNGTLNSISPMGEIGRITPSGSVTEFPLSFPDSAPVDITAGPDGNLWFTELGRSGPSDPNWKIGRLDPTLPPSDPNFIQEFPLSTPSTFALGITAGPDGNVWFTASNQSSGVIGEIGSITTTGSIKEFPLSTPLSPTGLGITAGPDGNLWFTAATLNSSGAPIGEIGSITTAGTVTEFPLPNEIPNKLPWDITAGPDGNLWFTECVSPLDTCGSGQIGRITPSGSITEFPIPTANGFLRDITAGPDGNLWFTEEGGNQIGKAATTSATALAFIQQPSAIATVGQPFAVQPQVAVQDTNGNTVTSDTSTVTLSVGAGSTGSGNLTCTGGLSQAAVNGVASFTGCQFDAAGTYTIHASDGTLTPADSSSISVGPPLRIMFTLPDGTKQDIAYGSPQSVVVGQRIVLSAEAPPSLSIQPGSLSAWSGLSGQPVPGVTVGDHKKDIETQSGSTDPANFATPTVQFYWLDTGQSRQITISATLSNGEKATAIATFNVDGPQFTTVTTQTGSVASIDTSFNPPQLVFGDVTSEGITFNAFSTAPAGGTFKFIQIVTKDVAIAIDFDGTPHGCTLNIVPALDNSLPYPSLPTFPPLVSIDSPHFDLPKTDEQVRGDFSAQMYLEWVPDPLTAGPGAIPVPLGLVSWSATGVAVFDKQTMLWKPISLVVTPSKFASDFTPPSFGYPTWGAVVKNEELDKVSTCD